MNANRGGRPGGMGRGPMGGGGPMAGLGMTGVISKHGGTIVATSPPGQGAIFTIVLPQNPTGGLA